ncbi:hypothetical protein OsJ_17162 [Oryza sativa Japonica Group]|uniref:FAR1 domain-containing protein n=1 Tax=Oryza sativa subsp. japonica TaxID=39947 RepID=B9FMI6_ORYSJ|nr:hypothetical protein OsJ_17162 [Oryza sativa Japonica Group]
MGEFRGTGNEDDAKCGTGNEDDAKCGKDCSTDSYMDNSSNTNDDDYAECSLGDHNKSKPNDPSSSHNVFHSVEEDNVALDEYWNIVQMNFQTEDECYNFYNSYAKRKGFSVRKDIVRREKRVGAIEYRRFVCSKEGIRDPSLVKPEDREFALQEDFEYGVYDDQTNMVEQIIQLEIRRSSGRMSLNGIKKLNLLRASKETLQVKDGELQNLANNIRARDATIKEIADKLTQTAQAAEAAASATHTMDEHRRLLCSEIERLRHYKQWKDKCNNPCSRLSKEKDQLLKERDAALQEAHMWRTELGKAREQAVVQEATIARVDGMLRASEADAWMKTLECTQVWMLQRLGGSVHIIHHIPEDHTSMADGLPVRRNAGYILEQSYYFTSIVDIVLCFAGFLTN